MLQAFSVLLFDELPECCGQRPGTSQMPRDAQHGLAAKEAAALTSTQCFLRNCPCPETEEQGWVSTHLRVGALVNRTVEGFPTAPSAQSFSPESSSSTLKTLFPTCETVPITLLLDIQPPAPCSRLTAQAGLQAAVQSGSRSVCWALRDVPTLSREERVGPAACSVTRTSLTPVLTGLRTTGPR